MSWKSWAIVVHTYVAPYQPLCSHTSTYHLHVSKPTMVPSHCTILQKWTSDMHHFHPLNWCVCQWPRDPGPGNESLLNTCHFGVRSCREVFAVKMEEFQYSTRMDTFEAPLGTYGAHRELWRSVSPESLLAPHCWHNGDQSIYDVSSNSDEFILVTQRLNRILFLFMMGWWVGACGGSVTFNTRILTSRLTSLRLQIEPLPDFCNLVNLVRSE